MFTGIIESLGTVVELVPGEGGVRLRIEAAELTSLLAPGLSVGASVAIDGACLTVTEVAGTGFWVEAVPETLARTTLGSLSVDDRVNLERAMAATGRFEGHLVAGHVDATALVVSVEAEGAGKRLGVRIPARFRRYVVEKGSIALDGVSLTVARRGKRRAEVALIPHTLEATTLGLRRPGDRVNLEVDMIAKYVEMMVRRGQDAR